MPKSCLEVAARVHPLDEEGGAPWLITAKGQAARTLMYAIKAGEKGFTSLEISSWALRTSHYVYLLRNDGLTIDMKREDHDGPDGDSGWHGRYTLRNRVDILETRGVPSSRRAAA